MEEDTIPVTLEYQHPDAAGPTRYTQYLAPSAIGAVILVLDALSDEYDADEIRRITERVAEAVSG